MKTKILIIGLILIMGIINLCSQVGKMGEQSTKELNFKRKINYNELVFIENKGQIRNTEGKKVDSILFYCQAKNLTLYFMQDRICYVLAKQPERTDATYSKEINEKPLILRYDLVFKNSNKDVKLFGNDVIDTYFNYFLQGENISNVKGYKKITYKNIFPNTDIQFYQKNGELKYDIIIYPGGNPSNIKFEYIGVEKLILNQDSRELTIKTVFGNVLEKIPVAYQYVSVDSINQIPCKWKFIETDLLSFDIANYDIMKPIIIDPILSWSTYLGGQEDEWVGIAFGEPFQNNASGFPFCPGGISIDSSEILQNGNIIVTGTTNSLNFPANLGTFSGDYDVFVFKLTPDGSNRIWGLFIGGEEKDCGIDVCVDTANYIYAIGTTRSSGLATDEAYQREC